MKIISLQKGKTYEAIKAAADGFLYMVVMNHEEASRIAALAKKSGFDIPFPLTFGEFIKGEFYARGINGFVIDNADLFLQSVARGVDIAAITLNKEIK